MNSANSSLIDLLNSIGVSRNEAATYASLLKLEMTSIRTLAAESGINRGTTYEALKRLTVLGLVSVKQVGKREHYTAESPEKIYELIREKRRDLLDAATTAQRVVPDILAYHVKNQGRPLVRYYEDDDGVVAMLKDVLTTCRALPQPQYYAYSSSPVRRYLYRKYPQFTERRVAEDIKVKVIAVGEGGEDAAKAERKWLSNPPRSGISSYTIIYGDKVAIISIASDDTPYGVIIEDAGATAMQRLLFEQLWTTL